MPSSRAFRTALVAACLTLAAPATAWPPERNLGPVPLSGVGAANTIPNRAQIVIDEIACGDEPAFFDGIRAAPKDRPTLPLIAKAAAIAKPDSDYDCAITKIFVPWEWDASFQLNEGLKNDWNRLKAQIDELNAALKASPTPTEAEALGRASVLAGEANRLLNRLGRATFDPEVEGESSPCGNIVTGITPKVYPGFVEYRADYHLTAECLERQIAHVILAKDFVRHGNPGTGGLPCVLVGTKDGDWDMGVARLTRLRFYLQRAEPRLGQKGRDVLTKLHTRLLTLSGEPADEVHHIAGCGNPDNSYGTARDRLDDNDFYDPDLEKTVEGSEEGEEEGFDFLGLLLLVLLLLAIGLSLAAIAGIVGALFGAAGLVALGIILGLLGIPQLIAGAIFGGIEETENHLLMQNSSKYLMNKILRAELQAVGDDEGVEEYDEFNRDIHEWFMKRLQRIAREDFAEYNARPYGGLSVTAILNVHDFACEIDCSDADRRLQTAAAAVLDLTAAKMALGSNQSRRIIPFRRLAHTNTNHTIGRLRDDGSRQDIQFLSNISADADHLIGAMQFWSGQAFHGPAGLAHRDAIMEMTWHATSAYRPDHRILDIAIDKSTPYTQNFRHAGWEKYSSGPGWLLTAGGTSTGYAQGFRTPFGVIYPSQFIKDDDRGAGVPTTLIVSTSRTVGNEEWSRQDRYQHFLRFEGAAQHWKKSDNDEPMSFEGNFCVQGSFACGINMKIPEFLGSCSSPFHTGGASGPQFLIIDSGTCAPWNDDNNTANDFYAIVYSQGCRSPVKNCNTESSWGFVEIVRKSAWPSVDALGQHVASRNTQNFDAMRRTGGGDEVTYRSAANGDVQFDPDRSLVTAINGNRYRGDPLNWSRAVGEVINRRRDAHYTIRHPRTGQIIEIDYSNEQHPRRVFPQ